MSTGGSLGLVARSHKGLVLFVAALFIFSVALFAGSAVVPKSALAAGPVVTLQSGTNGCNGVVTTPGSENTNKRLVGGSLVPGGTATFEISFPVDASDVGGDFRITDCVFIGGDAALKYFVDFVPNTENFILTFTLHIPSGTPIGAEYCNYAKTTESPSASPASNRKAGPACFVVGGNISVLKTNEDGDPLAGAHFHIVCTIPTTEAFLPDTIIDGDSHNSTSGGVITQNVVTGSSGRIVIQAPNGTSCVITETQAPDGYDLASPDHVTLVATVAGVDHTFVDPKAFVPAPGLTVDKGVSLSADGPFVASLSTNTGVTVFYRITVTNTGNVVLHGVTLTDNTFDLVAKGCTIPDTLAVGAHFDCDYSDTAVTGTTTNIATGDSDETDSDTGTATVTAEPVPAPALSVDKGVSLSADGPFVASLDTTAGTTVFYRITITNTGNTNLTGVTLTDNTFDLVAKGCTIPTTLAVGASFDCDYSAVAVLGTTTNIATGDSEETDSDTGTATVTATPPPAPALTVDKGVSLSADGPFGASLTTTTGTTVFYRITITNTGNVPLSGVTLSDNTFDLVAKGCTIPTTLAVGASFDCNYSTVATTGTTTNVATGDSAETPPDDGTATTTASAPDLRIRKAVGLSADGPFVNILTVEPGTTVFYRITVTNTGDVELTGLTLTDDTFDLVAKGCTIPTTLAVDDSFNCDYSSVSVDSQTINTATVDTNETPPDSDTATVNPAALQLNPALGITKTNNAPAAPGGAKEGDTVTYTIDYTISDGPADTVTLTDKLPAGVTYVADSATDSENGELVFAGYDSATRTLSWTGATVTEADSVSYKATIDAGAADLAQPLVNNACIVATGTAAAAQVCDTSDVFVAPPPLAETSVPTAPRTDVLDSSGTATPGMNLGLVLLIIGVLAFAVLFVTPMPASTKNRIRRR